MRLRDASVGWRGSRSTRSLSRSWAQLRQLGTSLLVTTYQAGKLVMVRDEGEVFPTSQPTFPS
jgi:hypothetical protein